MKTAGFTLIELMITLSILGILAAIAYPSYVHYLAETNRADGQTALLNLGSQLETYYSNNNSYSGATVAQLLGSSQSPQGYYTLSISSLTANSYSLKATPNGTQASSDTECQTFTYNNLGQQGITTGPTGNPTGVAEDCW